MDTESFAYDLPADRIAQVPVSPRDAARLLVDRGPDISPQHRYVRDLPQLLQPGDLLVVNSTRVLSARLHLRRVTGGRVELLLLEPREGRRWEALARPSRRLSPGERLRSAGDTRPVLVVELVEPIAEGRWVVAFDGEEPVAGLLDRHGEVPLPPYITERLADGGRYQTVYADRASSVAAPTAGLHLSHDVLTALGERGVSVVAVELAVGLGTFRPITTARVEDHVMHEERYEIPAATLAAVEEARRDPQRRIVAVGTTVVRTLETWAATGRPAGRSDLYIRRPYPFAVVDRLLTNFHVPRSSLLVLVDAFIGPRWRALYAEALAGPYRFLSFGDAMLLTRSDGHHDGGARCG